MAVEASSAVEVVAADTAVAAAEAAVPSDGRRTDARKNIVPFFVGNMHILIYSKVIDIFLLAVVLSNVLGRSCSEIM